LTAAAAAISYKQLHPQNHQRNVGWPLCEGLSILWITANLLLNVTLNWQIPVLSGKFEGILIINRLKGQACIQAIGNWPSISCI
jgi:hypothetical protein